MTERIVVYTRIFYDNLTVEEKKALVTLKDRFGYVVYGPTNNDLAISFDVENVHCISSEKGQVLFERTIIP